MFEVMQLCTSDCRVPPVVQPCEQPTYGISWYFVKPKGGGLRSPELGNKSPAKKGRASPLKQPAGASRAKQANAIIEEELGRTSSQQQSSTETGKDLLEHVNASQDALVEEGVGETQSNITPEKTSNLEGQQRSPTFALVANVSRLVTRIFDA